MAQRHEQQSHTDHAHEHGCCAADGHTSHAHDHACCAADLSPDPIPAGSGRLTFTVQGLDCAEEVAVLKREIGPLVGGDDRLAFDVLNGRMTVLDDAAPVAGDDIRAAVARTGMTAQEWHPGEESDDRADRHRRIQAWLTALSGLGVFCGIALHVWFAGSIADAIRLFAGHGGRAMPWPEAAAYLFAIACGLRFVLPKAWYAARRLRPDMNLLMVIAVAGAIAIGELFEASTVAFLFALSLALESWSVGRARRAVSALLDLAPPTVRVRGDDGVESEIPAADAPVGTHFVVRPGERIPLDGRIVSGNSSIDQAPITGESVPVAKARDDEVFAGTINGEGAIEVDSTKAAQDTTLARIIRLVSDAHSRRAHVEQWVERFAAVYTPAIIVLAVAIFLIPPLAFGAGWADWFYRALVLLVIACPCALVISTPVSIVAALAAAARHGVLVKGGIFIELPAKLRALAFDKTGTLTRGVPSVVSVVPLNGHTADELIERAAALEANSNHPLALAVKDHAAARGIATQAAADAQVLPGKGVTGTFGGESFWLGSHRYLVERGQDDDALNRRARDIESDGRTVVAIGNERHVCGLLAIADSVRPGAAAAIHALRDAGIESLVMLTGDNRMTAEAIAREVGIDAVHAELLPEDKVEAVEHLTARYGNVAMVGDGVNDAPAMARASFGIAMGAAGSDVAIETADIALMTDELERLPWLIGHSKRTFAVIRQNIVFALAVKAAFVVLTFAGFATLWGAIAADVGASLLVVANALRLLHAAPVPTASGADRPAASGGEVAGRAACGA